ncbi:MAG: type II toxin-antitoxin system RelE/ParE family toxin [Parabacteroides sp.]|nr:type II toxin-antitoxin system RelE/ParE family toxin [Parabacteroides sp.]
METKWFTPALRDLQHIHDRCCINFGIVRANKIADQIQATIDLLGGCPGMGPLELLLCHRAEAWRSFVIHRNVKVIYIIGSQSVNIAALWDTRRQPKALASYIDKIIETEPAILNEPVVPYIKTDKKDYATQ